MSNSVFKVFRVFTVLLITLALIVSGPLSVFSQTIKTDRIAGADRIATAISASERGWNQADTVILNEYDNFSDAIAATPLAVKLNAPILLTKGNALDGRVITELERLKAKHIILLGGKARLTPTIESELTKLQLSWERLGGQDRYATSVEIAKKMGNVASVIIANGENFPDALSAASYAGIQEIPILLTTKTGVPNSVKEYFNALSPENVIVIGGPAVIPSETLKNAGIKEHTRLGGQDRYATNEQVYDYAKSAFTSTQTFLASGENYPDAIVGAVLAAKSKAPLLLTPRNNLASSVKQMLDTEAKHIASLQNHTFVILGGTQVISENVENLINQTALVQEEPSTLPQESTPIAPTPVEPAPLPPALPLQGKTIIVDPGHGGDNPGAIGPAGTKEAVNNLAISQYLLEELRAAGANVVLTRTGDYSPDQNSDSYNLTSDLQARVDISKANKADLFVSIHNDSHTPTSEGSSTYYSSSNPQSVQSKAIAGLILKELTTSLNTRNVGLLDKNFYVLRHNPMPSVLVEVAFISNPKEEALLNTPDFRKKAAQSIAAGIIKYYSN